MTPPARREGLTAHPLDLALWGPVVLVGILAAGDVVLLAAAVGVLQ